MTRPARTRIAAGLAICFVMVTMTAACSGSPAPAPATSTPASQDVSSPAVTTSAPSATPVPSTPVPSSPLPTSTPTSASPVRPSANAPVIVIDPGHSPSIHAIDPKTGLDVSDYENEPEMHDVFAVAELVKAKLQAAGYRVVMTKNSATDRVSLGQRAAVANNAHAALALSIHDQAGPNGGIQFSQGNNIVYYQTVGDYRETPKGTKVFFTSTAIAAISKKYGEIFQAQRSAAQGHPVQLQRDVGYNLGTRGLPAGNIWMVQLLSTVPWIYNEAGGNSPGLSGLSAADTQRYANGLVASVERCVPIPS
jgi:N-acetylmuramoyl-L-alanine amidase